MFANLDYKNIAIIVVVILFYLRLYMLRGQKMKQNRLEMEKARARKKKMPDAPANSFYRPRYQVSSWWIMGPAILLCLFGLTVLTTQLFPEMLKPHYWLFIVLGGILFIFSFK